MVISSLIVETFPGHTDDVAKQLEDIQEVEVHGTKDHQVIVTIETETLDESHSIANSFIGIDGVGGVNLVYANFEDDPSLQKAAAR
ncbi:MAG: chaperone NapD [Eggerthellaceae bacterium]|jgi:nitrate reductase NapD|nr:chaperone NapD [Eggerthellaceae bacterium]MDR2722061.1 chaperone NapD [Coriobacteriaceae bacterium]